MSDGRQIPPEQDTDGLSALRRRLAASQAFESGRQLTNEEVLEAAHFRDTVALGFVKGMELLLADPTVIDNAGKKIYEAAAKHWRRDASGWVADRLLWIAMAITGIVWWVFNGHWGRP